MSTRGRPRNTSASIHVAIAGWLHPEHDADILDWLNSIPKGQRLNALKTALRSGGSILSTNSPNAATQDVQIVADDILSNWDF